MRRIALFLTATVATVILLFSYRTSRGPQAVSTLAATHPGTEGPAAGTGPGPVGADRAGPAGPESSASGVRTVNGTVAQTMWGPVQVRVTVAGGRITDVVAIEYPNGNRRDGVINSFALPRLREQVLAAQSAHIDGVSGATVTSQGYRQSLQAALDFAHFQ